MAEVTKAPAAIDLSFGPAGHLYATHPLHAFAARCPPPLVDWAITRYSRPGETVLDPMVGSGTTLVEAALLGRRAWGVDIDPLGRLIAKAKATPIPIARWDDATRRTESRLANGLRTDGWRPELDGLEKWFLPPVIDDLGRLRQLILGADWHPDVRDLLWVGFSALIVARTSVANARDLPHSRHHYRRWKEAPDVLGRFLGHLHRFRRLMADYLRRLEEAGNRAPEVRLLGEDARDLPLDDGTVDLVFTSPPYCSAIDYTRAHMFAVAWMPEALRTSITSYRELGRHYVGTERAALAEVSPLQPRLPQLGHESIDALVRALGQTDLKRAWIVHRYFREMTAVLSEAGRVVRPGGHVVLVICPSNIRKVEIPTHRLLATLASAVAPLETVEVLERTINERRRVMPYIETTFGPRMREEYVVVLRRPSGSANGRRSR
jgi:DNA methylase